MRERASERAKVHVCESGERKREMQTERKSDRRYVLLKFSFCG